jgi:hypothetical protein
VPFITFSAKSIEINAVAVDLDHAGHGFFAAALADIHRNYSFHILYIIMKIKEIIAIPRPQSTIPSILYIICSTLSPFLSDLVMAWDTHTRQQFRLAKQMLVNHVDDCFFSCAFQVMDLDIDFPALGLASLYPAYLAGVLVTFDGKTSFARPEK